MTRERNDSHSTEFGLWVREQSDLDSFKGYRNYNLDSVWWLKEGFAEMPIAWMLIEEKRFLSECSADQKLTYQWLHRKLQSLNDPTYYGINLLQFENTSPEDGKIYLDKKEATKQELIQFLQFKKQLK